MQREPCIQGTWGSLPRSGLQGIRRCAFVLKYCLSLKIPQTLLFYHLFGQVSSIQEHFAAGHLQTQCDAFKCLEKPFQSLVYSMKETVLLFSPVLGLSAQQEWNWGLWQGHESNQRERACGSTLGALGELGAPRNLACQMHICIPCILPFTLESMGATWNAHS